MKKIIKKLFTFLCVLILIFSFSGCNAISPLSESELLKERQNGITAIDSYLNEIRQMNLPYNLIFIEHEAKTAKEGIQASVSIDEIRSTTQNALAEMETLIAPDKLFTLIEEDVENIIKPDANIGGPYTMEFYLGSYNGYYFIIANNFTAGHAALPTTVISLQLMLGHRFFIFNDEGFVDVFLSSMSRYLDFENPAEAHGKRKVRERYHFLCEKIISGEIVLEKPFGFPKD